jgi:hypothetical protein
MEYQLTSIINYLINEVEDNKEQSATQLQINKKLILSLTEILIHYLEA